MKLSDLCERIGVSPSNASAKFRGIWRRLDLVQLHPDWCLPSMLDDKLLAWIVEVNGLPVDLRMTSREGQEEAYRLGLHTCRSLGVRRGNAATLVRTRHEHTVLNEDDVPSISGTTMEVVKLIVERQACLTGGPARSEIE